MSCDVLVLGGGIVGLACARELAGEGLRVEVLDSEPILAADGWRGASWAAAGMLAPLSEAPEAGALFDAARASRDLWPGFARELREESDLAVDHDASGALMAALTPGSASMSRQIRTSSPCITRSAELSRPGFSMVMRRTLSAGQSNFSRS